MNIYFESTDEEPNKWSTGNMRPYMCMVFYSEVKDVGFHEYLGARLLPYIQSNTWGPTTFIIAHGDGSTPNNPNGIYRELLEKYILNVDDDVEFEMQMYVP